jgi:hypothetical protein
VCQVLNIIILCPIIYLDYFWCIKYQYMHLYMKIGKEKGEKEKGRMDLPSSKFSWHERSISERLGSCPSSGATISGGSDPSSPSKNRQ